MSFGIAELALQAVIQDGLANLRAHPHHLAFILGSYSEIPYVQKRVGPQFVKNAMDMILKNTLTVQPNYTMNIDTYPCVVIAAAYTEDQEFLGDFGQFMGLEDSGLSGDFTVAPNNYAQFDATAIQGDEILLDPSYKIENSIFTGLYAVNKKISVKITGINPKAEGGCSLHLEKKLPAGAPLKGWKVQNLPRKVQATLHASQNAVQAQISLFTSGDAELHRVYAQIIRYCLKRGRQTLEQWGLQNTSFGQQPATVAVDEGPIFQSSFSMQAVQTDSWIADDWISAQQIDVITFASNSNPENETADTTPPDPSTVLP